MRRGQDRATLVKDKPETVFSIKDQVAYGPYLVCTYGHSPNDCSGGRLWLSAQAQIAFGLLGWIGDCQCSYRFFPTAFSHTYVGPDFRIDVAASRRILDRKLLCGLSAICVFYTILGDKRSVWMAESQDYSQCADRAWVNADNRIFFHGYVLHDGRPSPRLLTGTLFTT